MSAFARRVAALTGISDDHLERLSGGDLSEVLLVRRADGHESVAKGGPATVVEAGMLRAIIAAGVPAPMVEAEHDGVLLLEHVPNDGVFSAAAWRDLGVHVRRLHDQLGDTYGWPADYRLGTVEMDNRPATDWPGFWGERRLIATAALLDRPWRDRVHQLAGRLAELLPPLPPPALLHGDLWPGNILVANGAVAALIDPACYYGHNEVDLAMLTLFGSPPDEFLQAYGPLDAGWQQRRAAYQTFPALVHLRLFGQGYAGMVDRLLSSLGA